ncbi:MAG: peptidylprolyl isomerase [Planctomycetota bacterium]|jgi:cyclophilin family peptidyl-prolyl cis-trans isomerase
MTRHALTKYLLTGLLGLALGLPAAAQTGDTTAKPAAAPAKADGPPTVRVLAVVGSPKIRSASGEERPLEAKADIAFGETVMTGDGPDERLAIYFARPGEDEPGKTDLLILGPKSRVKLVAPTPELAKGGPGKEAVPAVAVADLEQGIYHAVVRNLKRSGAYMLRTGPRHVYLDGCDALGSYDPKGDLAAYIALTGTMVMHTPSRRDASRMRRVKVRAGLVRTVDGGRVQGARALSKSDREAVVALTRVPAIDVSQPEALVRADDSVKPPPRITNPLPWQYDAATNRHFDPNHGHWHDGRPPAGKSPPSVDESDSRLLMDKQASPLIDSAADDEEGPFEYVRMTTNKGDIVIRLNVGKAPISVANFIAYTKRGFYDGTVFHRVIPNFMIQGGGFTPELVKKPDTAGGIKNEWQNGLKNTTGTIAMARLGQQPDSATCQFFINVKDNPSLDLPRDGAGYAVFGRVIEGMETVEAIRVAPTRRQGAHGNVPIEPVIIEKVVVIDTETGAEGGQ